VLRCALLKQQRQLSYDEPACHLKDSASFRVFARLSLAWSPKKSVLHHTRTPVEARAIWYVAPRSGAVMCPAYVARPHDRWPLSNPQPGSQTDLRAGMAHNT
jgi:hypothetical protein